MAYFIYKLRKRLIAVERRLAQIAKKEVEADTEKKSTSKKPRQLSLFDLDVQEEMSKGVKVMAKMKKDKGIIREIGLFKAGIILGLAYALFNLLREAWDKVKHHFDEEEGAEKDDEELDFLIMCTACEGLKGDF